MTLTHVIWWMLLLLYPPHHSLCWSSIIVLTSRTVREDRNIDVHDATRTSWTSFDLIMMMINSVGLVPSDYSPSENWYTKRPWLLRLVLPHTSHSIHVVCTTTTTYPMMKCWRCNTTMNDENEMWFGSWFLFLLLLLVHSSESIVCILYKPCRLIIAWWGEIGQCSDLLLGRCELRHVEAWMKSSWQPGFSWRTTILSTGMTSFSIRDSPDCLLWLGVGLGCCQCSPIHPSALSRIIYCRIETSWYWYYTTSYR